MPVPELSPPAATRPGEQAHLSDAALVERTRAGDERSFETIFRRHHPPLLSYCRHMLGNQDEAEDALQQAFIRAHRALLGGSAPRELRPWLYAITRNCCLSAIAGRRPTATLEDHTPSLAGLSEQVHEREDLRELVGDIGRLPEQQRSALLLAELDDLPHQAIATIVGCPVSKVKALVYQARTTLIAERDARSASCREIREQLSIAHGGELRRGPLRRHLAMCAGCSDFQHLIAAQRQSLAAVLPVLPTAGIAARVLAHSAHAGAAAHAAGTATATGSAGIAASGTGGATTAVAGATAAASGTSAAAAVGGGALAKLAVVGTVAAMAAGAVALPHRSSSVTAHAPFSRASSPSPRAHASPSSPHDTVTGPSTNAHLPASPTPGSSATLASAPSPSPLSAIGPISSTAVPSVAGALGPLTPPSLSAAAGAHLLAPSLAPGAPLPNTAPSTVPTRAHPKIHHPAANGHHRRSRGRHRRVKRHHHHRGVRRHHRLRARARTHGVIAPPVRRIRPVLMPIAGAHSHRKLHRASGAGTPPSATAGATSDRHRPSGGRLATIPRTSDSGAPGSSTYGHPGRATAGSSTRSDNTGAVSGPGSRRRGRTGGVPAAAGEPSAAGTGPGTSTAAGNGPTPGTGVANGNAGSTPAHHAGGSTGIGATEGSAGKRPPAGSAALGPGTPAPTSRNTSAGTARRRAGAAKGAPRPGSTATEATVAENTIGPAPEENILAGR